MKLSDNEKKEYMRVAKLAGLTACAHMLVKAASSDDSWAETGTKDIVNIVARADAKVGDEVITLEPHLLAGELMKATEEAIGDLQRDGSITPEDMDINTFLGTPNSVLETVLTNPDANVGGVDVMPDVKIKETNLVANKKGEDTMNEKQAFLKMMDTIITKQAAYEAILVKLAEAVEAINSQIVATEADPGATETATSVVAAEDPAKIKDMTQDSDIVGKSVEGNGSRSEDQIASNQSLMDNAVPNKDASLDELIKKYLS